MRKDTLIPAVRELLAAGRLHEFDGEWIARLKPESQLAAAEKCVRGFNVRLTRHDDPGKSRIAHPAGSRQ